MVGLRLQPGQHVPEHRNAVPVAMIITEGTLHYGEDQEEGVARQGELVLINPGERHRYWATEETTAYLVFAAFPASAPVPGRSARADPSQPSESRRLTRGRCTRRR